jgi:oligoribonuclease NrnB/cAMP/cGMP phosphodiesterase (DHH superfamily)
MKLLCIYHADCLDGFTAAWVVRNALGEANVDFYAATYGQPVPDVAGRDVLMVDFSYPEATLRTLARSAHTITILDHHASAERALKAFIADEDDWFADTDTFALRCRKDERPAVRVRFSMCHSGARLAWNTLRLSEIRPTLVAAVEDRDLWRFALPWTKEICAFLQLQEKTFEAWDAVSRQLEHGVNREVLLVQGSLLLQQQAKLVADIIRIGTQRWQINKFANIPVVNAPSMLASDIGNILSKDAPFAATYFDVEGERRFSLRSAPEGEDVSRIAETFGGGGHAHAAGFSASRLSGGNTELHGLVNRDPEK